MPASILKILHLDDDALFLEQFADMLRRARLDVPLQVDSVGAVDEYFARLAAFAPDIVVLDIKVEGALRGQDVAQRTKALRPETLVFMCSDLKGLTTVSACLAAGADDFIFKSGDERELALRLYGTWKLRSAVRRPSIQSAGAVGRSMDEVATRLGRIVGSAITAVHVRGESGTGKELVSELLQAQLPRGTPLVRVNCGAIAPSLLESELFGHVRGAFTGAQTDKIGLIEQADGGWIFFDEVAALSAAAQVALLRVLESHAVRRVGASSERSVKVRVLSATNEPVEQLINDGRFRGDLWQRLCEATIELKPLRLRMNELPELTRFFCREMAGGPYAVSESALDLISSYDWRDGNVRELRNCLRAMTEMAVGKLLTPAALPQWFWEKTATKDQPVAAAATTTGTADHIVLAWPAGTTASYEQLAGRLLLAIAGREAEQHGRMSIRHLARVTGVPRSTLAVKLKELVKQGVVTADELARVVKAER